MIQYLCDYVNVLTTELTQRATNGVDNLQSYDSRWVMVGADVGLTERRGKCQHSADSSRKLPNAESRLIARIICIGRFGCPVMRLRTTGHRRRRWDYERQCTGASTSGSTFGKSSASVGYFGQLKPISQLRFDCDTTTTRLRRKNDMFIFCSRRMASNGSRHARYVVVGSQSNCNQGVSLQSPPDSSTGRSGRAESI